MLGQRSDGVSWWNQGEGWGGVHPNFAALIRAGKATIGDV